MKNILYSISCYLLHRSNTRICSVIYCSIVHFNINQDIYMYVYMYICICLRANTHARYGCIYRVSHEL